MPALAVAAIATVAGGSALPPSLRVLAAIALVFVLPGLVTLQWSEGPSRASALVLERLPRAFGLSFVALTIITVAATELHLSSSTVAWAMVATMGAMLPLALRPSRVPVPAPPSESEADARLLDAALLAALAALGLLLWWAGGLYGLVPDGEEALHLTLARKLFDQPAIARDNLMYRPGVPSTYLYLPYHLGLAAVARLARVDPLVAYMQTRPLWGLVAITATGSLAAALGAGATASRVVTALCLVLAFNGRAGNWSGPFGRLVPYSHHADVSLGVLLPVALVASARFLRGPSDRFERFTAPALLVATAIAHTREGVQLLFYMAALGVVLLFTADARPVLRRCAVLGLVLLTFGIAYSLVHHRAVAHIQGWEHAERAQAREYLGRFLHDPVAATVGLPLSFLGRRPNYLTNLHSLFHPYVVLAFVLAPALLLRRRRLAELFPLAGMAATLAVVFVPILSVAMVLTTYSQVLFTPARYVLHLGYVVLGLAVLAGAHAAQAVGRALASGAREVTLSAAAGGREKTLRLSLPGEGMRGRAPLGAGLTALAGGAALVGAAAALGHLAAGHQVGVGRALLGLHAFALALVVLVRPRLEVGSDAGATVRAGLLALVLAPIALWPEVDRSDLGIVARTPLGDARAARARPDVFDERAWYEDRAPLPIPYALLEDVRRMPPGVVAADPGWMWQLPAFANHYVFAAGQYLSTEEPLVETYARVHGLALPPEGPEPRLYGLIRIYLKQILSRFPIFNDDDPPEATLQFLRAGAVRYVIAPAAPPRALRDVRARWPAAFRIRAARDGWTVYEIDPAALPTAVFSIERPAAAQ